MIDSKRKKPEGRKPESGRQKHRLPNHFGTIRHFSGRRRNPYGVYTDLQLSGNPTEKKYKRKRICFVPDWETGYQILMLYHAGKYVPGMEKRLCEYAYKKGGDAGEIRDHMIRQAEMMWDLLEYKKENGTDPEVRQVSRTFADIYNSFFQHQFGPYAIRKLSHSTQMACHSAWMKLAPIHDRTPDEMEIDDLEKLIYDVADAGYSKTTVSRVVILIRRLYRYAYDRGYCRRDHGRHVQMPAARQEQHHEAFTDEELRKIWEVYRHSEDRIAAETCRMILIMCYSGFRIREYETLQTFLDAETPYFWGGLKTEAGRERIVPIHSAILPLVREIMPVYHSANLPLVQEIMPSIEGESKPPAISQEHALRPVFLCGKKHSQFRRDMKEVLIRIGVDTPGKSGEEKTGRISDPDICDSAAACCPENPTGAASAHLHTPHSTRHTFSRLCESAGVNEADRKRMLGHSLKNDITNGVYGHRSVKELSVQIEKIKIQ